MGWGVVSGSATVFSGCSALVCSGGRSPDEEGWLNQCAQTGGKLGEAFRVAASWCGVFIAHTKFNESAWPHAEQGAAQCVATTGEGTWDCCVIGARRAASAQPLS